jgi:ribosomal protein S18 acetylase RimI-like enzyme
MGQVKTRRAVRADLDAIAPLFDAYRQFYEKPADLPLARQFLDERFAQDDSVIFVAEDSAGRAVGFTQLYPTYCSVAAGRIYVLYDLFVTPSARGTGAGRALMETAESFARRAGALRLQLQTATTNLAGQSLYESSGWLRDNDFYVYEKTLSSP